MEDAQADGREDEEFVGGEVELDAGHVRAARGDRAAVGDAGLAGELSAGIPVEVEPLCVRGDLDPGAVVDGVGDVGEHLPEEILVEVGVVGQGEVEVLGEPVGLEEALLQAGAPLEGPSVGNRFVVCDAPE